MRDIPDTQENRVGIAEHTFSFNGDVGMPDRISTVQAEEGCLAFGRVKGQSRLIRPSDNFIYSWLYGHHYHVIIAGITGYLQMICIRTHIGIRLEFGQQIVYVDCEKEQ